MNIAHIITRTDVGGAQVWVRDQLALFDDSCSAQIVISNKTGWLSHTAKKHAKFFFVKNIERFFSFFVFFKIVRLLNENNIDTVIASSASAGVYARLYKIFNRQVKIIYVSHGWSCIYNGGFLGVFYKLVERLLSNLTDRIICVSNEDYLKAIKVLKISEDKLVIIRNAVFPSKLKTGNLLGEEFRLLFVGRLTHPKRFDLLIEAVSTMPSIKLDIVGPIIDDVSHLMCYEHIRFLGEVPGFNNFDNYDCFALISDSEGLPMSALEASSAGLPLILSDVGGCKELVNESNGLLVDNTIENIRLALDDLIENYPDFKVAAVNNISNVNIFEQKINYESLYFNR